MNPSTQSGVNAKRSFILISSTSSKDRVKRFQGTPIIIEVDSPITPAAATSEDTRISDPDASVGIQMPLHSTVQQGYSSCPITYFFLFLFSMFNKTTSTVHPFVSNPFSYFSYIGFFTFIDAEAGTSIGPNTIEKKNRKKRAAKLQSPDQPKKLKISREVDVFFSKNLRKPFFKE